jgi:hypothetical protein
MASDWLPACVRLIRSSVMCIRRSFFLLDNASPTVKKILLFPKEGRLYIDRTSVYHGCHTRDNSCWLIVARDRERSLPDHCWDSYL